MIRKTLRALSAASIGCALCVIVSSSTAEAQSGLRESLERLDRNENGNIDPDEITSLSRPYLERIARSRRIPMERPMPIDKLQEAARIYYAMQNGVAGKRIEIEDVDDFREFEPRDDDTLVPEFGLSDVKYPYTRENIERAERTIDRYDRDRDGFLSRKEAARADWTHRDPFESDLNKDDRLSRMELCQRYARRDLLSGDVGELIQKARRVGHGIEPAKPSGNQQSSRSWGRSSESYLTHTVLGRFDRNRNGRLEPEETETLGLPKTQIDTDLNGELTREELHNYLAEVQQETIDFADGLPTWFFEYDANRDKQITMPEFAPDWTQERLEQFIAFDTNADGILTTREIVNSSVISGGSFQKTTAQILPPRKTVVSEIDVTEDFLIGDLNVQLSITHTQVSQLDAFLVSPDGQRIELFTEIGGHDDHFDNTVFDDQSRMPVVKARPPFKGRFMPEALTKRQPSLSSFNGKSIKGIWQLVIQGSRNERFGMLHNWRLMAKPIESTFDEFLTDEQTAE